MTDLLTDLVVRWLAPVRRTVAGALGRPLVLLALLVATAGLVLLGAGSASAAPSTSASAPAAAFGPVSAPAFAQPAADLLDDPTEDATPNGPRGPRGPQTDTGSVTVDLGGLTDKPSNSVVLLLTLTLLSLLPAIVLTCTSFAKILVVLGLTRNALGLQQTPPNQVLAGLALFLSLFIMGPVLSQINDAGVQPYLDGEATASQAWDSGIEPLRTFMLANADDDEIELLTNVADRDLPETREDTPMSTLVPAFVLSELKDAFIIGFIIFIPFLIIDIVVSGALMALGMMMMPPVMVSLPFKLLLFVLVNGWGLVITALVGSYG
ncbi:flagellar type III secretion system pore protein FliP [Nocardioides flavescens]|uniref:Flagellar biosynthetic protein FliP n=1 Tax=Nocardioides flavescens TaxID=2691959 RepID=A0A6L7EQW6_9ACTN|nr:flagellar type III secretion system pore protein FliP [Nocardioides flavescens]MXG87966.1 flagellar type III secretion system pore protein FliP [Nocardioides flavescens]